MTITTFSAPDIECDGCANSIKKALGKAEGISEVRVDVPAKTVTVTHDDATAPADRIIGALDRAGFPAAVTGGKA